MAAVVTNRIVGSDMSLAFRTRSAQREPHQGELRIFTDVTSRLEYLRD
jgi:hypothetical protein